MRSKITIQGIKDYVLADLNKMIKDRRTSLERLEKIRDDANGDNFFNVLCYRYCPNDDFGIEIKCCGASDGTGCEECWEKVLKNME